MTDLPTPPPAPSGFLPPQGARPAPGAQFLPPGGVGGDQRAFALPAASWGRRAAGVTLDALLVLLLAGAVAGLVAASTGGESFTITYEDVDAGTTETDEFPYWAAWGIGVLGLLALTYPWVMLGLLRGATPGRRMVGIRVVDYDGEPVTMGRAFVREVLCKGVLSFFTLPLLLSYLWPLWDRHQRALHDLMASTRVVLRDGGAHDAFGGGTSAAPVAPPRPASSGGSDDLAGRIGLGG